ncbi:TonB-dependent receptor [Terrimonas sp.]|uniref:TonB-dependent receptor n=1 Tax=Terrimonas sp. TaxID=1914338 RepID=UPI000D51896A|nr:TonB-dependent receptor [Terrimonas sp.]PVD50992.1 TonB-dependent receptor [Terrimonas sp.]
MQYKKILLTGIVCLCFQLLTAQQKTSTGTVSGIVKDKTGSPVPHATISIKRTAIATTADESGKFTLKHVPAGNCIIVISAVGFTQVEKKIAVHENTTETLVIETSAAGTTLETVSVIGRSATQLANRQSYNVTAIDAKQLHNSTLDLSHTLDRVSGVRVRETGGVGSSFNFSLNGFSGNQVKFFLDGVPMDNFGSSFQINNIPINFADRVEVYKGVVPIWLGSDALGGAVNIITGNKYRNYIDASYSYGSFNTHRSAINTAFTTRKGFTVQLNAFQNYSDNNYKVTLDVADINTGRYYPNTTVKRFHDRYHNETLVTNIGFVNKKWADKFLVGITLGKNSKQIQTGARMVSVFGAWNRSGSIIMPALKYQKRDLIIKGLDVMVNVNYNLGSEQNIDTAFRRYDWFGNYKQYEGAGSERSRTMYKFRNNIGLATTTASYKISDNHSVAINNVYSSFNRKGSDELYPDDDKYQQPQKTDKNILGLSYKFDYKERWSIMAFGKHLFQHAHTRVSYNPSGNYGDVAYKNQDNNISKLGYGVAASYFITSALQVKASYERSNRLPENEEMFGDLINQESNFDLKPEKSDNVNLGVHYSFRLNKDHRFAVSAGGIYRRATDFIYFRLNANQSMLVADNLAGVKNTGGEGEIRYSYKTWLSAGVNFTYQNIINKRKYEPGYTGVSLVYNDRMPNLPFMFGNADAAVYFKNVWKDGDNLSIGYNLLYVHAFYLYWPSQGTSKDKYGIPQQLAHDVNIIYTLKNGRYNIGLECKNITNDQLYDNFSLQKPGRGFYGKLRYFFAK